MQSENCHCLEAPTASSHGCALEEAALETPAPARARPDPQSENRAPCSNCVHWKHLRAGPCDHIGSDSEPLVPTRGHQTRNDLSFHTEICKQTRPRAYQNSGARVAYLHQLTRSPRRLQPRLLLAHDSRNPLGAPETLVCAAYHTASLNSTGFLVRVKMFYHEPSDWLHQVRLGIVLPEAS